MGFYNQVNIFCFQVDEPINKGAYKGGLGFIT